LQESIAAAPGAVLECFGKRGTGELFPVEVTFNRLTALEQTRLLVNVQDITERREIERIKEEFFNMVSHDLRSPISAVHAILTMISEGVIDIATERGRDRLVDAKISTERVIDLVTELLDVDRSRAGKLVLDLEEVNLSAIVARSIETLEVVAKQKGLSLVNSTVDAVVLAEEGRLAQVLSNLMSNAIKFSPAGTTVEVSSIVEGAMCKIMVRDQGPGIPEEMRDSVFERFKQLPTAQRRAGSGLGLAFCKEIIKCHNGEIGVESEIGKGSLFWFTVQLAPAATMTLPEVYQNTI
ncbi:MAG TPA: HAMP domain-containing sensor histidine kinase, partial [Chroococcales cyanobacterium]